MSAEQRVASERFPRSSQDHPDWVLANASGGAKALWLTEWPTGARDLRPGMRVLEGGGFGLGQEADQVLRFREAAQVVRDAGGVDPELVVVVGVGVRGAGAEDQAGAAAMDGLAVQGEALAVGPAREWAGRRQAAGEVDEAVAGQQRPMAGREGGLERDTGGKAEVGQGRRTRRGAAGFFVPGPAPAL